MEIELENQITDKVESLLFYLGFSPIKPAWIYLRDAIIQVATTPASQKFLIGDFCRENAIKNKTTSSAVERAMRYAIDNAFCRNRSHFQETFPYLNESFHKPSNSEFISYCAYVIRQQTQAALSK